MGIKISGRIEVEAKGFVFFPHRLRIMLDDYVICPSTSEPYIEVDVIETAFTVRPISGFGFSTSPFEDWPFCPQ